MKKANIEALKSKEPLEPVENIPMKIYHFKVTLSGCGTNPEEAWTDCCEAIGHEGLGDIPDESDITMVEELDD